MGATTMSMLWNTKARLFPTLPDPAVPMDTNVSNRTVGLKETQQEEMADLIYQDWRTGGLLMR